MLQIRSVIELISLVQRCDREEEEDWAKVILRQTGCEAKKKNVLVTLDWCTAMLV